MFTVFYKDKQKKNDNFLVIIALCSYLIDKHCKCKVQLSDDATDIYPINSKSDVYKMFDYYTSRPG